MKSTFHDSPLLVVRSPNQETAQRLSLPDPDRNIFQRLIRNPRPSGRPPREIECTEMLVSVMLNAPTLRSCVLEYLAERAGLASIDFSSMQVSISTEQNVEGKRDDIRIHAWMGDDFDAAPHFLWSIEVKVGAGFHSSAALDDAIEGDAHQVLNYDHWLTRQDAGHRAGFVLAMTDMAERLPAGLVNGWHCLTWRSIAQVAEAVLRNGQLNTEETFLTRHFLGFAYRFLVKDMNDINPGALSFDDVAILRAYSHIGRQTRERVRLMIDPVGELLSEKAVFAGIVRPQSNLFGGHHRDLWYQSIADTRSDKPPYLMAGITEAVGPMDAAVWIETTPNYALKNQVRTLLREVLPLLRSRNNGWLLLPVESGGWRELLLARPLESIIANPSPTMSMRHFVASAIEDLQTTGTAEKLIRLVAD